jgi:hypothetical protein
MIPEKELRKRAKAKLKDAEVLFKNKRFDGSLYLCGYVLELALKSRTCRTLKWPNFPETNNEFQYFKSFRIHSLSVLLTLSGIEQKVKVTHFADWNIVAQWDPEMRYGPVGVITKTAAQDMITSTKNLLKVI